jgi:hypothetical protein
MNALAAPVRRRGDEGVKEQSESVAILKAAGNWM